MPKVIQWVNPREGDIVYRYPINDIEWGSQLIVEEYHAAVFLRDGKAYDVFRAGRHTITTANLPLLGKVLSRIAGYGTQPFKATVIFVSLKQFQVKFGGKGQSNELAPLMFHGSSYVRIEDPNLFVNEVVGGQGMYTTDGLNNFLRGYFNEKIIDEFSKYSLQQVYGRLDETSFMMKNALIDPFKRLGVELVDLKFEGLDTADEWRDRLFFIKSGVSTTEVLRMQTVTKAAESLSKSPGAALGAGLILPAMMGQPAAQPAAVILCPKCGFQNPQGARFCNNCGTSMLPSQPQTGSVACPSCGVQNPAGQKFCGNCGAKLQQGGTSCPSCGTLNPAGQKFCGSCGTKLTPA